VCWIRGPIAVEGNKVSHRLLRLHRRPMILICCTVSLFRLGSSLAVLLSHSHPFPLTRSIHPRQCCPSKTSLNVSPLILIVSWLKARHRKQARNSARRLKFITLAFPKTSSEPRCDISTKWRRWKRRRERMVHIMVV
jgi:hypothetical protein